MIYFILYFSFILLSHHEDHQTWVGLFFKPQRLCFCGDRFRARGIQQSCHCSEKLSLWAEIVQISDNEDIGFLEEKPKMKAPKRNSLHGVIQTARESLKDSVFAFQLFIFNLLWSLSHHLVCSCG